MSKNLFFFPLIGVLLVIISIPLPFQKVFRLSTIYPCDPVFALVFLGWLAYIIIKRQAELKGKELFLSFLPFIAAGIISGINAKDYFRLTGYIYLWSQIPLAYIMAVNIIKNKRQLNIVFYSFLVTAALFSCFYIYYVLRFHNVHTVWGKNIYFHKNIIASYIGLGIPLILGLILFKTKLKQKIPLIIPMLVSLAALLFTASRGGNSSVVFTLLLFIFFFIKDEDIMINRHIMFFIILLSLIFFIYMYFFNQALYNELFNVRPDLFIKRSELYKTALRLFRQHPIVGIGMGNFPNHTGWLHVHIHNILIQVLTETGLIGIGAFIFLLWNLIGYLIKAIKTCSGRDRYIIYGGICSLIYFFIHNLLDFTLGHGIGIQLGIILAIIGSVKDG